MKGFLSQCFQSIRRRRQGAPVFLCAPHVDAGVKVSFFNSDGRCFPFPHAPLHFPTPPVYSTNCETPSAGEPSRRDPEIGRSISLWLFRNSLCSLCCAFRNFPPQTIRKSHESTRTKWGRSELNLNARPPNTANSGGLCRLSKLGKCL